MMLRAYSSRIVRSVGCTALTLLLAATTCPTFGAPTARAVESLSAAERTSLPDATLVTISKTGRRVSLGVLRSEHKRRLQRFANASMLGKRAGSKFEKKKKGVSPGTLVPMNFSLQNFSAPGMGPFPPGPFPADFLAFCKAAAVTACLYLPSGFKMFYQGAYVWDMDDLITDQTMCTSEGGRPEGGGCAYYYPTEYNLEFNPGPPTAQGYNVTSSATCPSPFENTVDPRGAVSLDVLPNTNTVSYLSLTSLKTCIVRVFVKKLPVRRRLQITLPR